MELDREAEMGQEGATGMELVQRSHNHILTTPRWGARCAPRAALGTSGRSLPESPQQPSDAPFQRRERRGRPCSARSPRSPAEGTAAAERPTLPDAGCRWRPRGAATRGAARARGAGTWAQAGRSSCWRGRPESPCSSPSPSGS